MTDLVSPGPGVPLPRPTALSARFWEACADRSLMFQRCGDCDKAVFPPEAACTRCLSPELAWEQSTGNGRIHTYTVVHRAQQPAFGTPYAVAIVELDEGWFITANIVGTDAESLSADLPVRATFIDVGEGIHLPAFTPTGAQDD